MTYQNSAALTSTPPSFPKYRGAAPIQRAVINGDETTGVTIMQMAEGLDTGDILLEREIFIGPDETAGELFVRLSELGAQALSDAVLNIDSLVPTPQEEGCASWAPPLKKSDGLIDWSRRSNEIYSLIRGTSPWPGAYGILSDGRRLKIHSARLSDLSGDEGALLDSRRLIIGCSYGSVELLEVQLEGAKRISGENLIMGQRLAIGTLFK